MKIHRLFFLLFFLLFFSCQQHKAKAHPGAIEDIMDKYIDNGTNNTERLRGAKPISEEVVNSGLMGKWETIHEWRDVVIEAALR